MKTGRLGTLIGFGIGCVGTGLAMPIEHNLFGTLLIIIGVATLVIAPPIWVYFNRKIISGWVSRLGTPQLVLLVGMVGLWLSITATVSALAWITIKGTGLSGTPVVDKDKGPLTWFYNLMLEGGPPAGMNVHALHFKGANTSEKEVRLRSAELRSANKGTVLPLEVVAANDEGKNEIAPIDEVQLVPPGAPIELVAIFNPPAGLTAADFLATWSKFNLVVVDEDREYRVPFNEAHLAVFFPGLVGPRVTKKTVSGK